MIPSESFESIAGVYDSHVKRVNGRTYSQTQLRGDVLLCAYELYTLLNVYHTTSSLVVDEHDDTMADISTTGRPNIFLPAMQATLKIQQPQYNHLCDLCAIPDQTYKGHGISQCSLHAVNIFSGLKCIAFTEMLLCGVIDGKSMGHYCCGVFHCHEPLPNQTKRKFCEKHIAAEALCAGTGVKRSGGCSERAEAGYKTCAAHRSIESARQIRSEERFKARRREEKRNRKHGTQQYNDDTQYRRGTEHADHQELDTDTEDDDAESEAEMAAESDSNSEAETAPSMEGPGTAASTGSTVVPLQSVLLNTRPRCRKVQGQRAASPLTGRWSRRRTHNEQVFVRPCGIITFRRTLYDSEGPGAVYVRTLSPLVGIASA